MVDETARIIKDRLLKPVVAAVPTSITPSMITLASLPFGLAAAFFAGLGLSGGAVVLFVINRILDGLDGLVARSRGAQSDLGGYLDILVDFVVYVAVPVGVWWGARAAVPGADGAGATAWPLVVLLAVFYVNAASWMYLSAVIEKRRVTGTGATMRPDGAGSSTSVSMPTGLIEGTETVVFYLLFLLLPRWWAPLFLAMALGTAVGVVQRVVWAVRTLRE